MYFIEGPVRENSYPAFFTLIYFKAVDFFVHLSVI
jgi:hypothetical protein